jgi:hypothetical protein
MTAAIRSYELWDEDAPIQIIQCSISIVNENMIVDDIGQVMWDCDRCHRIYDHAHCGVSHRSLHPALEATLKTLILQEIERLGAAEYEEIVAEIATREDAEGKVG